jgi:hypothetical protein
VGGVYLAGFPKGGTPMTVFEALMIAFTFGLVIIAIMSSIKNKPPRLKSGLFLRLLPQYFNRVQSFTAEQFTT